jgi:hypothetical protein
MGSRPGPVRERVAAFQGRFSALVRQFVVTAIEQHELPGEDAPDVLTFELSGIILAANANFVLRGDAAAIELARVVVRRRLGVATTTSAASPAGASSRRPAGARRRRAVRTV